MDVLKFIKYSEKKRAVNNCLTVMFDIEREKNIKKKEE